MSTMSRKEQIAKAAKPFGDGSPIITKFFTLGAEWADENPVKVEIRTAADPQELEDLKAQLASREDELAKVEAELAEACAKCSELEEKLRKASEPKPKRQSRKKPAAVPEPVTE